MAKTNDVAAKKANAKPKAKHAAPSKPPVRHKRAPQAKSLSDMDFGVAVAAGATLVAGLAAALWFGRETRKTVDVIDAGLGDAGLNDSDGLMTVGVEVSEPQEADVDTVAGIGAGVTAREPLFYIGGGAPDMALCSEPGNDEPPAEQFGSERNASADHERLEGDVELRPADLTA